MHQYSKSIADAIGSNTNTTILTTMLTILTTILTTLLTRHKEKHRHGDIYHAIYIHPLHLIQRRQSKFLRRRHKNQAWKWCTEQRVLDPQARAGKSPAATGSNTVHRWGTTLPVHHRQHPAHYTTAQYITTDLHIGVRPCRSTTANILLITQQLNTFRLIFSV